MISSFESSVRISPDAQFLDFLCEDGSRLRYTYWETRLISASLARRFQVSGITAGDSVLIDLPNGPEFVFSVIACAYAGLTMILINNDLADAEKLSRAMEAERAGLKIACRIDATFAESMLSFVRDLPKDDSQIVKSIFGGNRRSRSIMGEKQDVVDDIVHFAERASHIFDNASRACVLFAGGRSKNGKPQVRKMKVVPLSWNNMVGAASLVNEAIGTGNNHFLQERLPFNSFSSSKASLSFDPAVSCSWQCVHNLGTIEGIQSLIGAIVAKAPFFLYPKNSAEHVLNDADRASNMMIALDDEGLQELLTIEEWRADMMLDMKSRLASYKCVLLIDDDRNARTLRRAYDLGTPIYACHAIVQAAGIVALARPSADGDVGLYPLEGYSLEIIDPDEDGFGKLALQGPGVFPGYLNSQTAFTLDHYFITEERTAFIDGRLYWKNRSENMFLSAGQEIYPVEIADVLRHVQGVSSVHVFGVKDSKCGMLPVAAIERSEPTLTPDDIADKTRQWFSNITVPISIFVFDQLPRTAKGKLDRPAIEAIFSS